MNVWSVRYYSNAPLRWAYLGGRGTVLNDAGVAVPLKGQEAVLLKEIARPEPSGPFRYAYELTIRDPMPGREVGFFEETPQAGQGTAWVWVDSVVIEPGRIVTVPDDDDGDDDEPPTAPASAWFVGLDSATKGDWVGKHGADGYAIATVPPEYPRYGRVSFSGQSQHIWAATSTEARALKLPGAVGRLGSAWYSLSAFTIEVTLSGPDPRRVSLYCLDWESNARIQRIDVVDPLHPDVVLDSRQAAGFREGLYLTWTVTGRVAFRVTRTGGVNAAVSGLFFDTPGAGD